MRSAMVGLLTLLGGMSGAASVSGAALPSCVPPEKEGKIVTIESKTRDGKTVSVTANLLEPEGEGPFPALVLLHGAGGLQPGYLCIAEQFVRWGYVALVIDSNSAPARNREYSMGSFLDTEQAQDAHAGRQRLRTLPHVDGKRIGVIGWSAGGRATLAAVSRNRTFYNGRWYGVQREGAFAAAVALYPGCYEELESLDAPVLILVGEKDTSVSAAYCKRMSLVGQTEHRVELKIYPDAEHGFDGPWSGWTVTGAAAADARMGIQGFFCQASSMTP